MSKLYVFGIGGTGSRVLKSLTMLLASGVKCGANTIVPIIIDPDATAADMTRGVESIKNYISIRKKLGYPSRNSNAQPQGRFFETDIEELFTDFKLPIDDTADCSFAEYMGVESMSSSNIAMLNMLFSQKNLDSNMKVGFKGNPNIGSIVLNQFEDSQAFIDFANGFDNGDRIFIISSIFGGTGASGFPLLSKLFRSIKSINNSDAINKAMIGAVTVMPYFKLKTNDGSEINSSTFISKTKAALSYYKNNISDNNTLDSLYYIGDDTYNQYENNEGGEEQRNDAHIVEFLSALAIIDFSNSEFNPTTKRNTKHHMFGLKEDSAEVIFGNFADDTKAIIKAPLTKFMLFCNYFKEVKESSYLTQKWVKNSNFKDGVNIDYKKLLWGFHGFFRDWLAEMRGNKRTFVPFKLDNTSDAFNIISGVEYKESLLSRISFKTSYTSFDGYLNRYAHKSNESSAERMLIDLFNDTTESIVKDKIK